MNPIDFGKTANDYRQHRAGFPPEVFARLLDCCIHPAGFAPLAQAGFTRLESCSFDLAVPYTHEGWRGRIRASAGVAASLPSEQVALFDAELAALLVRNFAQEPLAIPHRVFLLRGGKPAA